MIEISSPAPVETIPNKYLILGVRDGENTKFNIYVPSEKIAVFLNGSRLKENVAFRLFRVTNLDEVVETTLEFKIPPKATDKLRIRPRRA